MIIFEIALLNSAYVFTNKLSAPLIRSRPWRFINLFYLLTYLNSKIVANKKNHTFSSRVGVRCTILPKRVMVLEEVRPILHP